MNSSLTVTEIHLKHWRPFTISAGVLCVILFILFWNIEDPLWGSIFRIASFLCFAAAVFGGLKLMEGELTLNLEIDDRRLIVRYFKEGRTVLEEDYRLSTIKQIFSTVPEDRWSLPFSKQRLEGFIIDFHNSDRSFFLFEFGGRPLVFTPEDVRQITAFLSSHQLIHNSKQE